MSFYTFASIFLGPARLWLFPQRSSDRNPFLFISDVCGLLTWWTKSRFSCGTGSKRKQGFCSLKVNVVLHQQIWTTSVNAWELQITASVSRDLRGILWFLVIPAKKAQNRIPQHAALTSGFSEDSVSGSFWFAGCCARCCFQMCVMSSVVTFIFERKTFVLKGHTSDFVQRIQCVYFSSVLLERCQYYNYSLTAVLNSDYTQYVISSLFACLYNSRLLLSLKYSDSICFGCVVSWFQTSSCVRLENWRQ